MRSIITLLVAIIFVTTTGMSQSVKPPKKDNKVVEKGETKTNNQRTAIDYENFELTMENLQWARDQVRIVRMKTEAGLKNGNITQEEYEIRMGKIEEAENKIRDFEKQNISPDLNPGGEKIDPKDVEMYNKNKDFDKRVKEREEREAKKREANREKNLLNSYKTMLTNIEQQKKDLKEQYEKGSISESIYNQKVDRLVESEKRIKQRIEELENSLDQ